MIISDKHQIIFVHIPKCGGTSVRNSLNFLDERQDITSSRLQSFKGDIVDTGHITLNRLSEIAPDTYEKLLKYKTYTIIRDPYSRFSSSFYQYAKMYIKKKPSILSSKEVANHLHEVKKYLLSTENILDHRYIHFARQSEYIFHQNKQVVKDIYTIDNIDNMLMNIYKVTNSYYSLPPNENRSNTTMAPKNQIVNFALQIVPTKIYSRISKNIPFSIKSKIQALFFRNPEKLDIFTNKENLEFIEQYYKDDIKLYNSLKHE